MFHSNFESDKIMQKKKNRVANKTNLKGYVSSTMVKNEKDKFKMKLTDLTITLRNYRNQEKQYKKTLSEVLY